jgi:glucan phosphoethanolaminetransferase (alkaline phosphatase superfamily)
MGVTKQNYLKEMISNPSIWAYARKAGFRTAYLDGQRHGGRLQNHMNVDELALIDEFVQLDAKTPLYLRDIHLAQRLRAMLEAKQEPLFAIVNKMGAHFPYEGKYPSDSAKYQPTMAASYFGTEVDPRDVRSDLREDSENRRRYKNSYLNAIRWNTLQFFDALLPGLNLDETVIIYTSDHGQDFHEDGRPGYGTHCTDGPAVSEEGIVPLVFLTNERELLRRLRPAAESNANRASQFNLFPTLLSLMGYEDRDLTVESGFEPSLFTKLPDGNRRFLSTFYVRWGKAPVWNAIRGASQD